MSTPIAEPFLEAIAEPVAEPELDGTVRDLMVQEVKSVSSTWSVAEAASMMAEFNLRRVVVVDRNQHVVGVVSQRDVLRHYLLSEQSMPVTTTSIDRLITKDAPVTVSPSTSLVRAAVVLATNKVGCLPVVDMQQKLEGLLSMTDLLRHLTGNDEGCKESGFKFYTPATDSRAKAPAYIRRASGDLVLPRVCIDKDETVADHAVLGFDESNGCIMVRFLREGKDIDGAMKVKSNKEQIVICARSFVKHFELNGKTAAFDVSKHEDVDWLLLSPRGSV